MQKRITIAQLRLGMYIHDLNLGWMSHPFLRNRFTITSEEEIEKIRATGIHELYVDTALGLDVSDAPVRAEVAAATESALQDVARAPVENAPRVSLGEELGRATHLQTEARRLVRDFMQDVRLGKAVSMDRIEPLVEKMMGSIMRNSGALISLGQLKNVDDYTFEHSVNVGALMIAMCRGMNLTEPQIREVALGALLHDVGKMKTPLHILNKPGRYTDEEYAVMKQHPGDGHEILSQQPQVGPVPLSIVLQHHERMDGSGYPQGLKGDAISRAAQMGAIVDVYDAITSDRVYHKGIPPAEAIRKLYEWSKYHFNPDLVQQFVRAVGIYPVGALVRLESGKLAWVLEQNETQLLKPKVKVFYDAKKRSYITPYEVNLARNPGHGGADRILSAENPAQWGMDPAKLR